MNSLNKNSNISAKIFSANNLNNNYKQNNVIKIFKFNSSLFFYLTLIILIKLSKQSSDELYISIDFGNSKTSYAYTINKNIRDIKYGPDYPFFSEIILFKKQNYPVKNFGTKSFKSFINYNQKEKDEVVYIRNLKMNLYNYSKVNDSFLISTFPLNYNLSLEIVITKFLKQFSDYILNEINSIPKYRNKFTKSKTNFILTMPKIWDEQTKNLMKICAKKAGMEKLNYIFETEASMIASFEEIEDNFKKIGKHFMIINLGAQIIEITINKILDENGSFEEISNTLGGNFGSININDDLLEIFNFILDKNNIDYAKKNNPDEYLKILEEIEKKKKSFKGYENFDIEFSYKLTYSFWAKIFKNILELFKSKYHNYELKYNENKIFIPGKLMKEIIEKRVKETIDFINAEEFNFKKFKIDHIILTGGYSNCELLVNAIKKNISNIPISILMNPENSILKGALIYNIYKDKIEIKKFNKNVIKKNAISPVSINNDIDFFSKLIITFILILMIPISFMIYKIIKISFEKEKNKNVSENISNNQEIYKINSNSQEFKESFENVTNNDDKKEKKKIVSENVSNNLLKTYEKNTYPQELEENLENLTNIRRENKKNSQSYFNPKKDNKNKNVQNLNDIYNINKYSQNNINNYQTFNS